MTLQVEGAEKLALVGKAVRKLGSDRTVLKALTKRIRSGLPSLRAELKASALATLPRRGGLNRWVASSRVNVSVRRGANTAGVTVTEGRNSTGARSDLRGLDAGMVRHPTFGNREAWSPQKVSAGFATRVFEGPAEQEFRGLVNDSIDEAVAEVLRAF
jgi:hypothetical protein